MLGVQRQLCVKPTNLGNLNVSPLGLQQHSQDGWAQQINAKPSHNAPSRFGFSVSIDGDVMVVGAYTENSSATGVNGQPGPMNASGSGAAYVFVKEEGEWDQTAYLKASRTRSNMRFGFSVAVGGDFVVVGARDEHGTASGLNGNPCAQNATSAGAAYAFLLDPGCPADINYDGVIDADDFMQFLQWYAAGDFRADLTNDCVIDADDFFEFLARFASGC
ncbi:MAG: hypothetical protein JJU33_12540 [Phycisphaerales bacterium]|nr:hypothetical protein [Phycisphaerales bacterium]